MSKGDLLEIPALGRPFTLGCLYDITNNRLVPNCSLWKGSTLKEHIQVTPTPHTDFKVEMSDKLCDKTKALELSGHLKLSVLIGSTDMSGSAKYITNNRETHQRITLNYKCKTEYKSLTMHHLYSPGIEFRDKIEDIGTKVKATHVVTAIQYGAKAFFMFDQKTKSSSSSSNMGFSEKIVSKIPLVKEAANDQQKEKSRSISMLFSEDELKDANSCNVKYEGDFKVGQTPSTFVDAVRLYQELPKKLGVKGEHAVPVTVYLTPLSALVGVSDQTIIQIEEDLITRTEDILDGFKEMIEDCVLLLEDYPDLKHFDVDTRVKAVKQEILRFQSEFKIKAQGTIDDIKHRRKTAEAYEKEIFEWYNNSPYLYEKLHSWYQRVEKLARVLQICYNRLEKLSKVELMPQNEKLLGNKQITAVCLIVAKVNVAELTRTGNDDDSSDKDVARMTAGSKVFEEFYEANKELLEKDKGDTVFAVLAKDQLQSIVGQSCAGIESGSISIIQGGKLIEENFKPPECPKNLTLRATCDSIFADWEKVEYAENKTIAVEAYCVTLQLVRDKDKDKDGVIVVSEKTKATRDTIKNLQPGRKYDVRVFGVLNVGKLFGKKSECVAIATKPTSVPRNVRVTVKPNSLISIEWKKPKNIGVPIEKYEIKYKEKSQSMWQIRPHEVGNGKAGKEFVHEIDLEQETQEGAKEYSVTIITDCGKHGQSLDSEVCHKVVPKSERKILHQNLLIGCKEQPTMDIYKLNLEKQKVEDKKPYEVWQCGKKYQDKEDKEKKEEKVILLMGAPKSGTVDLLNGMVNYIYNVEWKDDDRFQVSDTEAGKDSSLLKVYTFHSQPEYSDEDRAMDDVTVLFLSNVDNHAVLTYIQDSKLKGLHAILVALPGNDPSEHKNFCKSVEGLVDIFEDKIRNHVMPVLTFSDLDQEPTPALKELRSKTLRGSKRYFLFNNTALFAHNGIDENNEMKLYWDKGKEELKAIFEDVAKINVSKIKPNVAKRFASWVASGVSSIFSRSKDGKSEADNPDEIMSFNDDFTLNTTTRGPPKFCHL